VAEGQADNTRRGRVSGEDVRVRELRAEIGVLEEAAARERRHLEEAQALQVGVVTALTQVREDAQAALEGVRAAGSQMAEQVRAAMAQVLGDARAALATAQSELAAVRKEVDTAKAERAALAGEVTTLRATISDLEGRRERLHDEVRQYDAAAESARERAELAAEKLAVAEESLAGVHAQVDEQRGLVGDLEGRAEVLHQQIAELEASHRPLHSYVPPVDRPRLSYSAEQCNTRLERLDVAALRLYATEARVDIRAVLTAALRDVLPHDTYARALDVLREQAERDLTPATEAEIKPAPAI
jgi:chromosome segregation ATPase